MPGDNLIRNLAYWARVRPDCVAVDCDGVSLTWRELEENSNRIAHGLLALGIGKGSAVGLLMRNRIEFPEAILAILKAGGTIVLLNMRYTPAEIRHPITDAGITMIVSDEECLDKLAHVGSYAPDCRVFTIEHIDGHRMFDDLRTDNATRPDVAVESEDIAFVCYTSGTTGLPKGAMISHGAIYAAGAAKTYVMHQSWRDRMLIPMPMAYTAGSIFFVRDGIQSGMAMYYLSRPTAEAMFDVIEREKITAVEGVAVLFESMMNSPRFERANLSSLRHAVTGGQAVTLELLRRWQAKGVGLGQGYGQTESAGSYITILNVEEAQQKIGFAGRAMPNLEVKVIAEDGTENLPMQPGEILVRGASMMTGYLNRPDETAETLRDGWLHTGDIGVMDEDGYLKIVDRTKDMLISGGLNVYPAEIEHVLGGFSGLEEVAVIGVPDSRWGEVPMLISPNLAAADIEALKRMCKEQLADYKRPRYAVQHPEPLPRTFSGKIQKQPLRDAYTQVPPHAIELR